MSMALNSHGEPICCPDEECSGCGGCLLDDHCEMCGECDCYGECEDGEE